MNIFNARTQQIEDVSWTLDGNDELIATFADGGFLKFPHVEPDELKVLIDAHESANGGQEIITEEQMRAQAKQQEANEKLLDQLNGNTMPDGDKAHGHRDDQDKT